jgi:hypothetical protein
VKIARRWRRPTQSAFFNSSAEAVVVAALTWFALRLIDIVTQRMEDHLTARGQGTAVSMLPLGRRTAKAFLIAIAALALLQNIGFNVSGLIAGLGVGGLAVALAAQETIKNFFGGLALSFSPHARISFCKSWMPSAEVARNSPRSERRHLASQRKVDIAARFPKVLLLRNLLTNALSGSYEGYAFTNLVASDSGTS